MFKPAAGNNGCRIAYSDTMAKQVGAAYRDFATNIVEANLMEG